MRLPYAPTTPAETAPESTHDTYAAITARRAPRPLQSLDLALLHSPAVASGWNSFLGAVRTRTRLGDEVLELAVSRVGALCRAGYEWEAHAPLALKAGVGSAVMERVADRMPIRGVEEVDGEGGVLSRKQRAVLAYADEMTREVDVRDEVFAALREWFDDGEVVELTAAVAAYNCVSRFLVAMDVGERNGKTLTPVAELVKRME